MVDPARDKGQGAKTNKEKSYILKEIYKARLTPTLKTADKSGGCMTPYWAAFACNAAPIAPA